MKQQSRKSKSRITTKTTKATKATKATKVIKATKATKVIKARTNIRRVRSIKLKHQKNRNTLKGKKHLKGGVSVYDLQNEYLQVLENYLTKVNGNPRFQIVVDDADTKRNYESKIENLKLFFKTLFIEKEPHISDTRTNSNENGNSNENENKNGNDDIKNIKLDIFFNEQYCRVTRDNESIAINKVTECELIFASLIKEIKKYLDTDNSISIKKLNNRQINPQIKPQEIEDELNKLNELITPNTQNTPNIQNTQNTLRTLDMSKIMTTIDDILFMILSMQLYNYLKKENKLSIQPQIGGFVGPISIIVTACCVRYKLKRYLKKRELVHEPINYRDNEDDADDVDRENYYYKSKAGFTLIKNNDIIFNNNEVELIISNDIKWSDVNLTSYNRNLFITPSQISKDDKTLIKHCKTLNEYFSTRYFTGKHEKDKHYYVRKKKRFTTVKINQDDLINAINYFNDTIANNEHTEHFNLYLIKSDLLLKTLMRSVYGATAIVSAAAAAVAVAASAAGSAIVSGVAAVIGSSLPDAWVGSSGNEDNNPQSAAADTTNSAAGI
jgi:hypothetical protein